MADKHESQLPAPVLPSRVEIAFQYQCPFCSTGVRILHPVQPVIVKCPRCHEAFPIAPVSEKDLAFFHILTSDGRACVQMDYL